MEEQRRLSLIDERRNVPDIDRLMKVDKLAGLPQPIQELAEILLHQVFSSRVAYDAFLVSSLMPSSRRISCVCWPSVGGATVG